MEEESIIDDKNKIVMKLLHYFITEKNYNPIILQGVENEIWLENLSEDYKVVRIVSGHIHNDEQYDFDKFKTKRILKKIKKKTLSLNMNVFSFFLNISDNVTENLTENNNSLGVKINDEKDLKKNETIKKVFPDLSKKTEFTEDGMELFAKITSDINIHNQKDADRMENLFREKLPLITNVIICLNVLIYLFGALTGNLDKMISMFCVDAAAIRKGEIYRLFTAMFIHENIFHLLINCYIIYSVGSQLESFLGKIKYLIIYLFGGLVAALFSMSFLKTGYTSLGTDGVMFAIMGSLIYFGYHYRVYLGNVIRNQIIPFVILSILLSILLGGIDIYAYIGGLLGGLVITIALGVKDKTTTFEKVNGWIVSLLFLAFLTYIAFIYTA